jgi:hypothetical protein
MRLYYVLLVLGFGSYQVGAFAVFAHFMVRHLPRGCPNFAPYNSGQVGNTRNYNAGDWQNDMNAAKEAGIDAFALSVDFAYRYDCHMRTDFAEIWRRMRKRMMDSPQRSRSPNHSTSSCSSPSTMQVMEHGINLQLLASSIRGRLRALIIDDQVGRSLWFRPSRDLGPRRTGLTSRRRLVVTSCLITPHWWVVLLWATSHLSYFANTALWIGR